MKARASAILAGLFLTFSPLFLFSQSEKSFPESWLGNWTGELEIYGPRGVMQTFPMALNIQATDTAGIFTWEIIYGEGEKRDVRPYVLKIVDAEKGHYQVDEKNSIILDSYWLGEILVDIFSVNNALLVTTAELVEDDVLLWQIISGNLDATSVTGGEMVEGEDIPEVVSYLGPRMQRARLKRQ